MCMCVKVVLVMYNVKKSYQETGILTFSFPGMKFLAGVFHTCRF